MMPKTYNPKTVEKRIYRFWEKIKAFSPRETKEKRKNYTLFLPPPNVTGELHLGHTLNAVIQDILARKKRMEGYKTLWVPGTDHAGIATQNVVEKKLKKEGKSRFDLGRDSFIKEVWKWKEKYGDIILDQLKKIGASCDWTRTRFTMDKEYVSAVKTAFYRYWKEGLVYLGERPVNWCKRCGTSLSDLELEHKKEKGGLWYIRYPLKDKNKHIVVATTRPETMLGDTAVAVNPKDRRYKNLVGQKAIVPLVNREVPIISDRIVEPGFGTGAVKITPAHDLKDYEIGLRHNLKMIKIINERGKITENGGPYQGLTVLEAREKIIERLKKLGLLEKEEDYEILKPKCYRCGTTIETIPSRQWFIKMDKLAEKAKRAATLGKIKFYPKRFEKFYFGWLKDIRDWCISRQIWWGHRLPVWRCQSKDVNNKVPSSDPRNIEKEGYFISLEKPKKCPVCGKCKPKQVPDVFDTWFSSALWPFATIGWPKDCLKKSRLKRCQPKKGSDLSLFYPAETLTTAKDIINLWVTRMVFSGLEFMGKPPFSKVFIHPTILNKKGQRMSKSLGTGINPIGLIDKYGADAVRFGLVWQLTGLQDIRFDEQNIVAGKKFTNKIWNASRFVLKNKFSSTNVNEKLIVSDKNLTKADKEILKTLEKTTKSIAKDLDGFRFGQAIQTLYHFFWHNFCDKYIEESKKQMAIKEQKENTKKILLYTLLESLKLLHPFMPFITEEVYQKMPAKDKKKYLMAEDWPNARSSR